MAEREQLRTLSACKDTTFSLTAHDFPQKIKDAIEQEPSELVHNWPSVSIFDLGSISVMSQYVQELL